MNADRFFEAISVAGFLAALGYGGGRLAGSLLVGMIRKKPDTRRLEETIDRLSGLERDLANRVGERRKAKAELDRKIKHLTQRRSQLDQLKAAAEDHPERVLRSIGQEVKGAQAFLALVLNKYVKAGGTSQSAIDPAWATAQEVEVWAKSLAEARGELDRRYPDSQGFKITSLIEQAGKPAL